MLEIFQHDRKSSLFKDKIVFISRKWPKKSNFYTAQLPRKLNIVTARKKVSIQRIGKYQIPKRITNF